MNEDVYLKYYKEFKVADLDNDMVGICQSLTNYMIELRLFGPNCEMQPAIPPDSYFKHDPHLPRLELRDNLCKIFKSVYEDTSVGEEKIINVYTLVLSAALVFNMPIGKMDEIAKTGKFISRDESKVMLLEDGMSPNWLIEPTGRNYEL